MDGATVYTESGKSKAFSGKKGACYRYRIRPSSSGGNGTWSTGKIVTVAIITKVTGLSTEVRSRGSRRWGQAAAWGLAMLTLAWGGIAQAAETTTYVLTDDQGTVLMLTDNHGNPIARFDNRPYGKRSGPVNTGPGYTGHVEDPDTKFVYMQARYYDPELGRFLSVDPIGPSNISGEFNRYTYVDGDPIMHVDPTGMACGGNGEVDKTIQRIRDTADGCKGRETRGPPRSDGKGGPDEYASILSYGGIDLSKNARLAKGMSHVSWVNMVAPGHTWDYKNDPKFHEFSNPRLLAKFGNWHFGYTGAANGLSLSVLMAGAGGAQVFLQRHNSSNVVNFVATLFMKPVLELSMAQAQGAYDEVDSIRWGLIWGDNPDDAQPIVEGFNYYENTH